MKVPGAGLSGYTQRVLRHPPTRAAWLLLLALPVASCDGSLRLVVVEQGGSGNLSLAGKAEVGGSVSGVPNGGTAGEAGNPEPVQGGTAGKPDEPVSGASGAPDVPIWEAAPRYTASFVPYGFPEQYVRHIADQGFIGLIDMASPTEVEDASFEMIPGLANEKCRSFRSVNEKRSFFRHSGSRIWLHPLDTVEVAAGTPDGLLYTKDATFCEEPGMADPQAITFRSVNYPKRVIHLRNVTELWIDDVPDPLTPEFAAAASFYRTTALDETPMP